MQFPYFEFHTMCSICSEITDVFKSLSAILSTVEGENVAGKVFYVYYIIRTGSSLTAEKRIEIETNVHKGKKVLSSIKPCMF